MRSRILSKGVLLLAMGSILLASQEGRAFLRGGFFAKFFRGSGVTQPVNRKEGKPGRVVNAVPGSVGMIQVAGSLGQVQLLGLTCQDKTDCALGLVCSANKCVDPKTVWDKGQGETPEYCFDDTQCPCGQSCNEDHYCEANPPSGPCTTKTDCPAGQICSSATAGTCVSPNPSCSSNDQCPCGQYCNGKHACAPIPDRVTPPTVTGATPAHNAVLKNKEPMTVRFSKAMNPDYVRYATTLTGFFFLPKDVSIDVKPRDDSGTWFTIIPKEPLQPAPAYIIKVTKEAKDTFGNALKDEFASSFNVAASACVSEPKFWLNVHGDCLYHEADICGGWDQFWGACRYTDHGEEFFGYQEGDIVVASGTYAIDWSTQNVTDWTDSCRTNFDQPANFVQDSDTYTFSWNGPLPQEGPLPGFTPASPVTWKDRKGQKTGYAGRLGGRFDCIATAHDACGNKVEIPYSYSCP